MRWLPLIACLLLAASGCSTLGYYAHVSAGQVSLLAGRESVSRLIADPATDASLRERLRGSQAARVFASDRLGLPRNRSYTTYVEIGRAFVTWNVMATSEFSVDPLTRCFPFAGCVAYLGFFDRARAYAEAAQLAAQGDDTDVQGAAAYSTLGWFADPIVSSMLRWSDDELDAVIFHELAHQAVYVGDDTAFNESFANFVGEEGVRQWRRARGLAAPDAARSSRDGDFTRLVLDLRERLRTLYQRELAIDTMRAAKRAEFDAFRERYAKLRDGAWNGDAAYDRWMSSPLNNASLVSFGLYDRWVPAFARLFEQSNAQWPGFLARVRALAHLDKAARDTALAALEARARPPAPPRAVLAP